MCADFADTAQKAPCSGMVYTWALKGLPCYRFGVYVYSIMCYLEAFGNRNRDHHEKSLTRGPCVDKTRSRTQGCWGTSAPHINESSCLSVDRMEVFKAYGLIAVRIAC